MRRFEEIGGYFELEYPEYGTGQPGGNCIALNSGRHALELYLMTEKEKIKKVWIPDYTCPVVVRTVEKTGIPHSFYEINELLEIKEMPTLNEGEIIILNNYFGIKDEYINRISRKYGSKSIIDCAQAWYYQPPGDIVSFYSARKFFGVADGGFLCGAELPKEDGLPLSYSYERFSHLLKRIDLSANEGYRDFRNNSETLGEEGVKRMSLLTRKMLRGINMEVVKKKRRQNFLMLHEALADLNNLPIPSLDSFVCPMVYPLMTSEGHELKNKLIEGKIYVATYWPGLQSWCGSDSSAIRISQNLVALPIDQRYGEREMRIIINEVKI